MLFHKPQSLVAAPAAGFLSSRVCGAPARLQNQQRHSSAKFVSSSCRPTAPAEEPVVAPVQEPAPQVASSECPCFPTSYQATNNLLKQLINKLLTKVNQDNPYSGQPSQFGVAVGGYWNWFLSALKRPTAVENSKALNGILQYVLTAFVLTLSTFFTASGATGGYGMDFRAFMLTLISLYSLAFTPSK